MESTLLLIAALLVAANVAAIALAYRVFPLWFLEIGQHHGRFAGLGRSDADAGRDSGRSIPAAPFQLAARASAVQVIA